MNLRPLIVGAVLIVVLVGSGFHLSGDTMSWLAALGWILETFTPVLGALGGLWIARADFRDPSRARTPEALGMRWLAVACALVSLALFALHLADVSWSPAAWIYRLLGLLAAVGAVEARKASSDAEGDHEHAE